MPGFDRGLTGCDSAYAVKLGKLCGALARKQLVRNFGESGFHIVIIEHLRHGAHRQHPAAQVADLEPAALQAIRILQKRALLPLAEQERPGQQQRLADRRVARLHELVVQYTLVRGVFVHKIHFVAALGDQVCTQDFADIEYGLQRLLFESLRRRHRFRRGRRCGRLYTERGKVGTGSLRRRNGIRQDAACSQHAPAVGKCARSVMFRRGGNGIVYVHIYRRVPVCRRVPSKCLRRARRGQIRDRLCGFRRRGHGGLNGVLFKELG